MKNLVKNLLGVVMVAVVVSMFASMAQAGVTHNVYGQVAGGNNSTPYKIYVVARPTEVLTGNLIGGAPPYTYYNNIGNLTSAWTAGEDCVAITWKEDNAGAVNHKGYYSAMNENLTTTAPQRFADCTLREIPIPTATANAGNGRVDIAWTAATQDQYEYPPTISGSNGNTAGANIIGYNVYRSTNGTSFTKANSSVVSGISFSDSGGTDGTTYYYAIEIVYKGGVVAGSGTPILSANSNSAVDPVDPVPPTGPALTAASPSSGLQGQNITEVTVTGTNTHFTRSAPTVSFGEGITIGTVTVESDTSLRVANVAIASSATVGSRVVSVSVTGPAETATGEVFSVSAPVTQVVIDNYEGLTGDHVADPTPATMGEDGDFYYTFEPAPAEKPTYARQGATLHAGSYAMSLTYPSSVQGWRGYGGQLRANTDISAMTVLSFWIKTDGSLTVKAQLKDSEGDSYASAEQAITGNTSWQEIRINLSAINTEVADSDLDNDGLDLNSIKEYQFVFVGSGAVTAPIYIDDVTAIVTTTPPTPEGDDPHIDTITSPAAPTDSITLTGTNFLTDGGEVVFVNRNADGTEGTVVTTVRSAGSSSPITVWDTARVTLTLPQMVAGQKSVRLTRTDGQTSNTVTLEVTASAAAGPAYNYPNPFNPISGERTNIIFTPGSATYAKILIFDMTAKIIKKLQWTGGTPSVEWDGKNDFGEIVGDGVYLYRVVDDGNKLLGKGKILAVNRR